MSAGEAPQLPAYPGSSPATWRIWCEWCKRWHTHTAGEGHRAAHCVCRRSPYRATGYMLVAAEGEPPKLRSRGGQWCGYPGACGSCPADGKESQS
jgi:hypothetical protein